MSTVRRRSSLAGDDPLLEEDTAAASSTSLHFGTASPSASPLLGSATTSTTNRTSLRPTTTTSTGVPLRGILKNGNSANSNKVPSHYREQSMSEALMESGWWKMRRRELQVQGPKFAMLLGGTVVVAWLVRSML